MRNAGQNKEQPNMNANDLKDLKEQFAHDIMTKIERSIND